MDTFELLSYMVEQEHEALDKLLEKITEENLDELLTESGDKKVTLGQRLAHLIGAEYRMATYLYQDESDDIDNFKPDPQDLMDLKEKSSLSKKRHLLTLQNLTKEDLKKVWTSKASGNSYDYKYLLWHFLEHLATHRGQIAMIINSIQ